MATAMSLVILLGWIGVVSIDWYVTHPSVISKQQAERIAIKTVSNSQPGAGDWTVAHSGFHTTSTTVPDRAGSPRFGSSSTRCPLGEVGAALDRVGVVCQPPPVWTVQVTTASRPTERVALVEIDATSGEVVSWLVDDRLP
jgi:hypothetical protein